MLLSLSLSRPAVRFPSYISKPVCPSPLLSFHPACLLFFSLVCTCAPPALSLSMSVCLPSPHWYALLPSTLSLTLTMIILFIFPFFLSSCLIVSFFVSTSVSLSQLCSAYVCVCCFSISVSIPPLPNLPSFLTQLLLLLLFTAFTESQGEEKEKNKKDRVRRPGSIF